jgi:hypothetical protein
MNLQGRSKRWLASAELAKSLTGNTLVLEEKMRAAGRAMPLQAHEVLTKAALYELRLTAEADPISEDVPLHAVVTDVVAGLAALKVGSEFRSSLENLDAALEAAVTTLRDWTDGNDSKIEEIVDELERAFLISLIITLTSHTYLSDFTEKWKQHHQRFLQGHAPKDLPHYIDMKTMIPCAEPGPGRIHVQHLVSALNSGATVMVAGTGRARVDNYPELQSVLYAQWFAYTHAIWDDQFRERIAAFFSTPERQLEKNDVTNDFFGDVRRIRNDFVHRKGIADEAVKFKLLQWNFTKGKSLDIKTEQMLSLIDLFPRDALMVRPIPRPPQDRKNLPGSGDAVLVDTFLAKLADLKLDKNAAIDEALTLWLDGKE